MNRSKPAADGVPGPSFRSIITSFPRARFYGYDTHAASIDIARRRAEEASVADRVTFEVQNAVDFPGRDYDFVAHFDCLHDLEDPSGAAERVREALSPEGTWMIVEPFASDRREQNHNPVGRVFYSASTMICVPHSLSRRGPALGAQAGEARIRSIVSEAGFTRFRRATETPFNMVLEARV